MQFHPASSQKIIVPNACSTLKSFEDFLLKFTFILLLRFLRNHLSAIFHEFFKVSKTEQMTNSK